ncbi:hypothetical protein NS506_07583 [Nocardia seriolae]|uniref:Uncharacterized protein n=1 Tax=Nocardia seriolae TaxID=37332 RepID=A0ABC8B5J6_9NOCA|nr:hypothetical protein NS506_07583 [Nocardia seriolae]BAW04233.1 hypothetical protein NSERUTF1_0998 [Nocardia seriolae]BEK91190.1 hypothetical protein NSERKGN1266_71410 [Nocardia seriolae]GEM27878.1 hypothetical protein NS2_61170 [Nocardia seriolae NBRC 15557]
MIFLPITLIDAVATMQRADGTVEKVGSESFGGCKSAHTNVFRIGGGVRSVRSGLSAAW